MQITQVSKVYLQNQISEHLSNSLNALISQYGGALSFSIDGYPGGQYNYLPNFQVLAVPKGITNVSPRMIYKVFSNKASYIYPYSDNTRENGGLYCYCQYRNKYSTWGRYDELHHVETRYAFDATSKQTILSSMLYKIDMLVRNIKQIIESISDQINKPR